MITESAIYWITRLDGVLYLTGTMCALATIAAIILLIVVGAALADGGTYKELRGFIKALIVSLVCALVFAFGTVLIPSTKAMCAIKIIPTIANNENVQQLPDKVVDLANEWIDSLKPSK